MNGKVRDLSLDSLQDLLDKGFRRLKIMYKEIDKNVYKTVNIENLKKYVYMKPDEKNLKNNFNIIVIVIGLILLLYVISLMKK